MAKKQDGWTDMVKLLGLSVAILVPLVGLILYQGSELRSEMRGLRGEFGDLRGEFGDLRGEFGDLRETVGELEVSVAKLEVAVARIEARELLRLRLAERFAASGEGESYGGPVMAADLLLARALPEIDAVLSELDGDAQTALADDLWEQRANILARAGPIP